MPEAALHVAPGGASALVRDAAEGDADDAVSLTPRARRASRPRRLRVRGVLHWLHVYTSMASLVLVLFFAVTGVTLNHPDWLATEATTTRTGRLPAGWRTAGGGVDWLVVAEHVRQADRVRGTVSDRHADGSEASLTFKAPGYAADCFINTADGTYRLTTSYQGALGVLNDLHRGRDAGGTWAWLIDAAGAFLALLSLTGLGLLCYLKKVRARALLTMLAGGVLALVLAALAR